MKRPPLKLIEWEDAFNGDHEWTDVGDVPKHIKPLVIRTVGFELRRDSERVTLAMSYGQSRDDHRCCDLFTIPLGMIRKERVLR